MLEPGEQVLWIGRPGGGLRLRRSDRVRLPVALFILAVAVLLTRAVAPRDGLLAVLGAVWIAAALYLAAGRFAIDVGRRRWTVYAVTDRRLIATGAWPRRWAAELPVDFPGPIEIETGRGGRGTLVFGRTSAPGMTDRAALRFDWIERPNEVFALIDRTRRSTGRGWSPRRPADPGLWGGTELDRIDGGGDGADTGGDGQD